MSPRSRLAISSALALMLLIVGVASGATGLTSKVRYAKLSAVGLSVSNPTVEGRTLTVRVRAKRNISELRFAIVSGKKQVAWSVAGGLRRGTRTLVKKLDVTPRGTSFRLRVTARRGKTRARGFYRGLRILPLNKPPTDISLSSSTVAENLAAGTTVGTLSATDPNNTDTHIFSLVSGNGGGDNGAFTVAGNVLKTAAPFDFEARSAYSVRVRVTDKKGSSFDKVLAIAIANANDAPTGIGLTSTSVAENQAAGATVGALSVADQDTLDVPAFTLVTGARAEDSAAFEIVGTLLKTKEQLDFETKSSYVIRVRVSDGHGGTFERTFTIAVGDVNDAPTGLALAGQTVAENQPAATTVGTLSAGDQDAGDTRTFALVSGTGSDDNASFAISGSSLRTAGPLDFEAQPSHTVRVRATDSVGATVEQAFTITVTDANDAPVLTTTGAALAYTENDPATVLDGALTVSDQDDTSLAGATVAIATGHEAADELRFTDQNGITGTYDSGTGVLTLTGTSTVADYQTALRSIEFRHTADNPATSKTVELTVDDGDSDSTAATRAIAVTRVNDAPALTTTGAALAYPENAGPVAADAGLTLTDPDSTQIQGATVQITSNFVAAQDELAFTDQLGITGSYNDTTGVLTLSGTTSVADYQAALRAVTYENSSDSPAPPARTVSFQATDAEGAPSNVATRDIDLGAANDAATITTTAGAVAYGEGDPAVTVDSGLTVSDSDDTNLEGAQVRVSAGLDPGDDLVFVDTANITGSYSSGTGVLTLTGTDTVASYQAALRSIQFQTTNDNPALVKTVEFRADDGDGLGPASTRNIDVTRVNDAPTVDTSGGTASFTENGSAVAVDPSLTVSDPDSAQLSGATVAITSGLDSAQDALAFVDTANITGTYNSATGVLTLVGADTVAGYQAALRSVTFDNGSQAPSGSRTVSFQVTDSSAAAGNVATRDVTLSASNDAPVLTTSGGTTTYTEGDPATTIDGSLTVADADDANLESGQVRVSSNFESGDVLVFVDTPNITGAYNAATGVLTLTGTDTVAGYQAALRTITFESSSDDPATSKTIELEVNDGDADSNAATKDLAITAVNDAPTVTSGGTLSYTENDAATAVDSALTLDDVENDSITSASASITTNHQAGQDILSWTDDNLADSITLDPSSDAQTIVLTGTDTEANYQAALRNVKYGNTSEAPSTVNRTVTFSATDQPGATGTGTRTIAVTAVDDPPTAVDDSATVLEDAAPTSIPVLADDTDVDGGPKTIASAGDPANGTVVLTGGSPGAHTGLTYQPDPNYCNDPPGTTPDTFTYTLNGGSNATVSMTVTCVNDAPVADDETFNGNDSAHGNTTMQVDDPDDDKSAPAHPHTEITGDILAGDTDVDGPGPLTVTPGTFATNDGGSVSIESDGDFEFRPAASTSCTDTSDFFDYTVEDSGAPEQTDTGRVTIAIAGCVWYVNNNAAGNSGTSSQPFDTLAQAETASGANHTVFVFDGDNTTTGYDAGGYQMNSGERLIGEHEGLSVDPDGGGALTADTLHPANAGAHPTLTANNVDVVDLDDGNEIRGLNVDPQGTGGGIFGGAGDTLGGTFDDVNIVEGAGTNGTGPGLELNGTTGTFNITNLTVDNDATGVLLNNAGTVDFGGDTGVVTLDSTGGPALNATGTNMGTSAFDGITVAGSGAGGVSMVNTTGTTTFGDGAGTDLALTTTSGAAGAFVLSNAGTVTVPAGGTTNVSATGGPAIDVAGTSGAALAFDDVDSTNSAGDGINLDGLGTGNFSATSGDIGGAAGISFDLNGGSGSITYPGALGNGSGLTAVEITGRSGGVVSLSGSITDTNDTGGGVNAASNTGGSTVLSGATKQFNTGTADAVVVSGSDGHTFVLSGGGTDIDTTSGKGYEATTSGTVQISGSGNTIDTGTGRALHISDTEPNAVGVTLQRLSSNGSASAVTLNNTGATGGVTVTGAGGACATVADNCSGGTIQSTTGDAIALTNTRSVSLTRMRVMNNLGNGIRGSSVTDFTLADSVIDNNADDAATDEAGLHFTNLAGNAAITRTLVANHLEDNARIINTSATLSQLDVTDSTFRDTDTASPGNNGLLLQADGGSITADVLGSTFLRNRANGLQVITNGTGSMNVEVDDSAGVQSAFDDNNIGVSIAHNSSGTFTYAVRDLTIDGLNVAPGTGGSASPINLNLAAAATSTMNGRVTGNTLTNSNSTTGPGIRMTGNGIATMTTLVDGNSISQVANRGIEVIARDGSNRINATITNNNVALNNLLAGDAIRIDAGAVSTDTTTICADVTGNTATTTALGLFGVRVRQRFAGTTFILEDYAGGPADDAAVQTFLSNNNNAATTSADHGGAGFATTADCPTPP